VTAAHLHPEQLTAVVVGDRAAVEPQLAELGLGHPQHLALDEIERTPEAAARAAGGDGSTEPRARESV
jgi:hypothetical protein